MNARFFLVSLVTSYVLNNIIRQIMTIITYTDLHWFMEDIKWLTILTDPKYFLQPGLFLNNLILKLERWNECFLSSFNKDLFLIMLLVVFLSDPRGFYRSLESKWKAYFLRLSYLPVSPRLCKEKDKSEHLWHQDSKCIHIFIKVYHIYTFIYLKNLHPYKQDASLSIIRSRWYHQ